MPEAQSKTLLRTPQTVPVRTITWPDEPANQFRSEDLVSEKSGTTLVNVLSWQLCSDQSAEPEARAATVTQCQGQLTSGSLTFTLFTFFAFLDFAHLEFHHCPLLLNSNMGSAVAVLEETLRHDIMMQRSKE